MLFYFLVIAQVDDETLPETEGFCALLDCCMNLTRLNIANIHFHERDRLQEEIQQAVSQIKGYDNMDTISKNYDKAHGFLYSCTYKNSVKQY